MEDNFVGMLVIGILFVCLFFSLVYQWKIRKRFYDDYYDDYSGAYSKLVKAQSALKTAYEYASYSHCDMNINFFGIIDKEQNQSNIVKIIDWCFMNNIVIKGLYLKEVDINVGDEVVKIAYRGVILEKGSNLSWVKLVWG